MSLDGKVLRKARDRLEENKRRRQAELNRRTAEVYAKAPVIRQIDQRIRQTAAEAITAVVSGSESAEAAVERISEENLALQEDREYELVMAGFPQDYLDDGYACETCRDTGFVDGKPCRCLMELYAQEQRKELSSLLAGGNESFDNFDLMLYDDKPDPKTGINPRQQMEYVYDYMLHLLTEYARLLRFQGGAGLSGGAPGEGVHEAVGGEGSGGGAAMLAAPSHEAGGGEAALGREGQRHAHGRALGAWTSRPLGPPSSSASPATLGCNSSRTPPPT